MKQKDFSRAAIEFRNAANLQPKNPEAWYQMGMANQAAGDLRSAVANYGRAVEAHQGHPGATSKLAELKAASGDPALAAEAEQQLKAVLRTSPGNPQVLNALALTELRLGNQMGAVEHLQAALKALPSDAKIRSNLASVHLARGEMSAAENALKEIAAQQPLAASPAIALGRFYALAREFGKAETSLRRAIELDKGNLVALQDLAEVLRMKGDMKGAEETFMRLSQSGTKAARPAYGIFLHEIGKKDQALVEFKKLYNEDPNDRYARNRLIEAYLATDGEAAAGPIIDAALRNNPKDADALRYRSRLALQHGDLATAEKDLNTLIGIERSGADAQLLMAAVHQGRGRTLLAKQSLTIALTASPRSLPARLALSHLMLEQGQAEAALGVLEAAPADQHSLVPFRIERGWVLIALQRFEEARTRLTEYMANSKSSEFLLQDGVIRMAKGDHTGAQQRFETVLRGKPDDVRALRLKATSLAVTGKPEAAGKLLDEVAASLPGSAPVNHLRGEWWMRNGELDKARTAFQAARSANPKFHDAAISLAQLETAEGRLDKAREIVSTVLGTDRDIHARLVLAGLDEAVGDKAGAVGHYSEVVQADNDNVIAHTNLAVILVDQPDRLEEAARHAQRARELSPHNGIVADAMGLVLLKKGQFQQAVTEFQAATASLRKSAPPFYHLAIAYSKAGDRVRAEEAYRAALAIDPKSPEAARAASTLVP